MKSKRDIKPISYVKAHAAEILSQVNETKNPVYITQNGEAKAVLLDSDTYDSIREVSSLIKLISLSEKDIENGKMKKQDVFFSESETELLK